jgi:hypothetical protein
MLLPSLLIDLLDLLLVSLGWRELSRVIALWTVSKNIHRRIVGIA